MANKKISALPAAVSLTDAEIAGAQGGATKKFPAALFADAAAIDAALVEQFLDINYEQNAALLTGVLPAGAGYEWSLGNGAELGPNEGHAVYVPAGYEMHLVAISFTADVATTATIVPNIAGTDQPAAAITMTAQQANQVILGTPIAMTTGQRIVPNTTVYTGASIRHNIIFHMRLRKT